MNQSLLLSLSRWATFAIGAATSVALTAPLVAAAGVTAANRDEPIQPIPLTVSRDEARIALGRKLFNDTRLSVNGKVACVNCHQASRGGADGLARSPGLQGRLSDVNTPTVLNSAFNFRQTWNGRAASVEDQIDRVVRNPAEMGSRWEDVIGKLAADPAYLSAFKAQYKDGLRQANVQNALASYVRNLTTPNSRFDRFLRGDADAITSAEKVGYAKFKQYGCVACHQGVNVGGNMFQRFGIMGDYFARRGHETRADDGRAAVTGVESDRHVFKVPSLRNVALTAPYFHDGSAATLEQAVDVMFRYQLGRVASKEDKAAIVRFLGTLNGEAAPW